MRLAPIILIAVALSACSANAPRESAHPTPIRLAFERGFMKSCLLGIPGTIGQTYCACTRDAIEGALTDPELSKVTPADPRVRLATHGCAAKAGLPIQPGY